MAGDDQSVAAAEFSAEDRKMMAKERVSKLQDRTMTDGFCPLEAD